MAVLPTDYTDSVTPTGATTEYPATTTRGLNATHTQINTNTTALSNVTGTLQPVRLVAESGLTYTISSGSVTQIAGTTIDGVTTAVGDRIAVVGAPTATGVGAGNSDQPGNGIYVVTNATTNTTLARASDMSGNTVPFGLSFEVREGTGNTDYTFYWVNRTGGFTWGTTNLMYSGYARYHTSKINVPVDRDAVLTFTNKTISGASNTLSNIPSTAVTGLTGGNTSAQSQVVVSATAYYVAGSAIAVPTNLAVGSRFRWTIALAKTAAGTGAFQIRIYRGTNGTTADTADVTQTIGTQTAAVDNMTVDVELAVTTTGATGAYYWSIIPMNKAVTATGFGVATGPGGQFSGTVSSVALNTASLKFGLSFIATTGTPTITVPLVRTQAYV